MASQAKVIIKGQNNIGNAVKSAASDLNSMKATADKLGAALKSAFTVTAILASVKKLGDGLAGCFSEFETADRAYKQLSLAIGDDSAYKSAVSTIGNLSKKTLSSKGDVEAMVSELAALGKSSEEVEKISSAALYLSNVTGKDLNSSMTTLLGTYNGTTTQLKKLGVDVSNLTKDELAQGAAIDVVIGKFGELSDAMAEASASQSLKNIKDTLGDIRQGFGQIISTSIKPMLAAMEEGLSEFQSRFQVAVDNITIMMANLPTVMGKVVELLKGMFSSIFEWENLKTLASGFMEYLLASFRLLVTNIGNLLTLFLDTIPSSIKALWDGIASYGMYIITNLCDDIGLDLTGLINSVGKWLTDSSIGKVIDLIVTEAVNGIRLVAALLKNVPAMFDLIVGNIGTIVSNLWIDVKNGFLSAISFIVSRLGSTISSLNISQKIEDLKVSFKNVFGHIGGWLSAFVETAKDSFRYIGDVLKATFSWDTIKNSALSMIESFCNFFIDAINSLIPDWFSKIPGLKEVKGISRVSLVDDDKTNPYAGIRSITKASSSYVDEVAETKESNVGKSLVELAQKMETAIGEKSDWSGISRQFSALLSPVFEEYSKESKTIGQTLATWTQKSSSEYLKNSKESFSSISGFLKAWGEDFVADNSEGRSEIIGIISSVGESLFGDDIAAFTTWLDGFLDEQKATIAANKATLSKSAGTEDSDDGSGEEENPFSSLLDVVKPLVSSLGIFGDMISGMNPLVAVLKPILEGFVSIMAPALKTVITPVMDALKWIGEALARTLLPILDAIFPSISMIADILIMAISPVLKMLSPVIQLVAAAFSILQPFIILVAKAFTVLASPVQFMGDLFTWLGSWLKYMGDCVAVCAWNLTHWFNQKSYSASPEAFSSDAFSGLGDRLSAIDKGTSSSYVTDSVSTGTSVSSAGYQGATQVTINIYQEAPIVGDGGMRQFATMIRQTFLELDYYGVST
jgi:hypothetical protein